MEETVSAVGNGTAIAKRAAEAMDGIVESSKRVMEIINSIAVSNQKELILLLYRRLHWELNKYHRQFKQMQRQLRKVLRQVKNYLNRQKF